MKYIIYVPQGHSSRLSLTTNSYNIEGLYTDRFSSCNIIACISQDKIALLHVDGDFMVHADQVKKEIEWAGESAEVIFIFREAGKVVLRQLLKFLREQMPERKFTPKPMDNQYDGIFVSFALQENSDLHPQIKKYPFNIEPDNLLHHPQEQRFLDVQKIKQIIGIQARQVTGRSPSKTRCIFDSRAWETLEDTELSVNTSHLLTAREMAFFAPQDPYIVLADKYEAASNLMGFSDGCFFRFGA